MKSVVLPSVLFALLSSSPDTVSTDREAEARERIHEMVVGPLEDGTVLWSPSIFSRARVRLQPPALTLWTSSPATDAEGRVFVRFRVEEVEATSESLRVTLSGCYYPATDEAFIELDEMKTGISVDAHPLFNPGASESATDDTVCRSED